MRIAISIETNNELESVCAHHFGRCPFFAIVDLEGRDIKTIQVIENRFFGVKQPGHVPCFNNAKKFIVWLCGGLVGGAIQFFQQFGIEAATGADGTVRQALEKYMGGELTGAAPCKESVEHGH